MLRNRLITTEVDWSFRDIARQLSQLGSLSVVSQGCLALASLLITRALSPSHWGWVAFGLTLQGYLVMISSGSMRSLVIERIGRNPHRLHKVGTAFVLLSSGLSLALALVWCGTAAVLGMDRWVLIPLCILAFGSIANGLYPTALFEANLNPLTPNRIASVVDFGFLLLVLALHFFGEIQMISIAILFASKWVMTAGWQWICFLRRESMFWIASSEEIAALASGIPHQAIFGLACTIPISSGILASQLGVSSSDAGFLSLATMVQQAYIVLSVQLHRIVQPRLVLHQSSSTSDTLDDVMLRWLSLYLLVLGLITWGLSSSVVWCVLPVDYRPVLSLLPWTILAGGLTSASFMASFQMTILGNQKYLSPIAIFVAFMHICLSIFVLRWESAAAIAILGAFSSGTSLLLLNFVLRWRKKSALKAA